MRFPRIITHVLDSESTTVTFGFMLFIVASIAAFITKLLSPDSWLWCVVLASILIGGKLVTKSILEAIELKLGGKPDLTEPPAPPEAPAPPKVPDAPAPPAA